MISSSSSSSDVSSSGSNSSVSTKTVSTAEVINALKQAASASSITVHYQEQDSNNEWVDMEDIYTSDYVSIGWSKSGYVLLPSYNATLGDKLVYSFQYDGKGNVVLGKATTYYNNDNQLVGVNSCDDMNYLKLFR